MNPVHTLSISFLMINFNIIILSMPSLPSGILPSDFLTKILYTLHVFPVCATCPVHLIFLDLIIFTSTPFGLTLGV